MYESKPDPLLNIGKIYVFQLDIEKDLIRQIFQQTQQDSEFCFAAEFPFWNCSTFVFIASLRPNVKLDWMNALQWKSSYAINSENPFWYMDIE